jgi:hypothetical protein
MKGVESMLIKFPLCLVKEVNALPDGGPQYITLLEPGGGEYNLTARPNDPAFPFDAAARLQPFAERFQPCEVEAEISGFISHKDGTRKQYLSIRKLSAKAVQVKADAPVPAK